MRLLWGAPVLVGSKGEPEGKTLKDWVPRSREKRLMGLSHEPPKLVVFLLASDSYQKRHQLKVSTSGCQPETVNARCEGCPLLISTRLARNSCLIEFED